MCAEVFISVFLFVFLGRSYEESDRNRGIENTVGTILFLIVLVVLLTIFGVGVFDILGVSFFSLIFLLILFIIEESLIMIRRKREGELVGERTPGINLCLQGSFPSSGNTLCCGGEI